MSPMALVMALVLPVLFGTTAAQAQAEQKLVVPLSNPGRPAVVQAGVHSGSIHVKTHGGKEVIVRAMPNTGNARENRRGNGMRRIPNTAFGLEIEENRNVVEIGLDWTQQNVTLEIEVPTNTSLELSTLNDGVLVVDGVEGDLELSNLNGPIRVTNVRGSVIASSNNGDVTVAFARISPDKAMSFSTLNGDVDVTFPPNLAAELRISSARGEIFTDFEYDLMPNAPVVEQSGDDRAYRVRIDRDVRAKVGSGGPEMHFKTFNGNIYIRKAGGGR
ncbi:hypothetical protein ABI59_22080 [Acidobacteria bacterium Mor1]|nr:hypothetical protein ABI59_22080 [Acidobacteria bacterium Mor1]